MEKLEWVCYCWENIHNVIPKFPNLNHDDSFRKNDTFVTEVGNHLSLGGTDQNV
jgi:hypothetical protein